MAKNLLTGMALLLVVALTGSLLNLVTCGLAGLLTTPFQFLLLAVIYLRATNQPIVGDRASA
ncbi:MAG: hypothetical protein DWQ37_10835 [Planctomycetota bacterium]|nr:MAG: hypothetical protein DWQ37_10835 [Planctomycetota bacterium]